MILNLNSPIVDWSAKDFNIVVCNVQILFLYNYIICVLIVQSTQIIISLIPPLMQEFCYYDVFKLCHKSCIRQIQCFFCTASALHYIRLAQFKLNDTDTVKPRFTVARFTGSFNLPGLNSIPRKQAICVNQCKMRPDLPCFSIYRA